MQFVRRLLLEQPAGKRIPIRSGQQTFYVNTNSILFVQGQRKRTEVVCIDRVIFCNSSLGEMTRTLPGEFYAIHRSYLVNTRYIVAVRRFEAELISGVTVPIPPSHYTAVKNDLQKKISDKP